jgi:hypothetical protein
MTGACLDCPLEDEQQSEHSRGGVVEDLERLGRFIYHDDLVDDDTGELKPGAFQMEEFLNAERRGASVARIDRSNADELRSLAASRPGRWARGLGVSVCLDIRQVSDSGGSRVFCALDDGLPKFEVHALITRSEAYRAGGLTERQLRAKLKPFRDKLVQLFSPVTTIEDVYS